jgi:2-polyprenyl-3-methyl-5-hydroxy-6-metoxy-1,4-benzoquinol methylase
MNETGIARTRDFFDEYAGGFNSIYSTSNTPVNHIINRIFRKSMRLRYAKTLEGCRPIEGKRVLDLGCGPGHYGIALAVAGAAQVVGIDFAKGMIDLANERAAMAGVNARTQFISDDFWKYDPVRPFDYVIVMGVMDYVEDPKPLIDRVLSMTSCRAFFSFPLAGGLLAWQRKVRYRSRCPLFLYGRNNVNDLFRDMEGRVRVEAIARDLFVEVSKA